MEPVPNYKNSKEVYTLNRTKYRTINDAEDGELDYLKNMSLNDPYKPIYHIHPEFGLLNDPNGLTYFNNEYHVFYQWYPFDAIHGMKHWGHVKSKDLVNWERMPVALTPTEEYESHGCYSGGAIVKDNNLYLYYTGNVRTGGDSSNREANQCLAVMDKNFQIKKLNSNPVIEGAPAGYTGHVRDPKVWELENGNYAMILGAQRENLTGTLLVYESQNAINWNFKGELHVEGMDNFGYMWECPDYFRIEGRDVLIFSPQGINKEEHDYQNIYNVIYLVGELELNKLQFKVDHFGELDKGFDFYAPQSFEDNKNRRMMFSWVGMGETSYPTDSNMWANSLSIPRILSINNNKVLQNPPKEMELLRGESKQIKGYVVDRKALSGFGGDAYELLVQFTLGDSQHFGIELLHSSSESLKLEFDKQNGHVLLDRSRFNNKVCTDFGDVRTAAFDFDDEVELRIFVDKSIVEIFINGGETVFTSRVFPLEFSKGVQLFSDKKTEFVIRQYDLRRGI